jgi:hypothetical protein
MITTQRMRFWIFSSITSIWSSSISLKY